MNLNDLKLFESVAYHGSFTKAAEEMYTVQSNVSARIKNLEEEFGAILFTRTSRKVELTPAGKLILQYARQIGNLVEEAKLSVGKNQAIKGQVKIGFLETTLAHQGPGIVQQMADKFPLVDLHISSAMRDTLVNDVLNNKLDAALIPGPIYHEELEQMAIKEEQIVVVTTDSIKDLDELLTQKYMKAIVFDQGCFFRARLEAWLINNNILNYHKTVVNSIEGVINFIESGIGFSFLPLEIVSAFYHSRKVKAHRLPKEIGTVKNALIYRKDNSFSPLLNAFISLFS